MDSSTVVESLQQPIEFEGKIFFLSITIYADGQMTSAIFVQE